MPEKIQVDWLIENGRVIDGSRDIDRVGRVAILNRRIAELPPGAEIEAKNTIDAEGCLVIPGMVDFHTHFYNGGAVPGVNPDLAYLPAGVTFAVDQGSAGFANYRMHLFQGAYSAIRKKYYLHISPIGQVFAAYAPEPYIPSKWDREPYRAALEDGKDQFVGLKLRFEKSVIGDTDPKMLLKEAVRLADDLGQRLSIHITDPALPMQEVVRYLRPGDTITHVFHGRGHTIFDENGRIYPEILRARENGVIYDVAHGGVNFSPRVARRAIEAGFYPDSISSDNTRYGWLKPDLGSLPNVMSMFLSFGMSVPDIIRRVTVNPARTIGAEDMAGTLRPGAYGDVTILKIVDKRVTFTNSFGEQWEGEQIFVPQAVILNGELVYKPEDAAIRRTAAKYGLIW